MKQGLSEIVFSEGLPSRHELESWHMNEPEHKLLVIDDLMMEASTSKDVVNIYCKYAHHYNFFVFLSHKMHSALEKNSVL